MTMTTTICQKTTQLRLESIERTITVRRLRWRDATTLLKKISTHVAKLGEIDMAALLPRLPELVANIDDLSDFLMLKASDITADDLAMIDMLEAAALLEAAAELNLGDDLKNSLAGIGTRLGALAPAAPTRPSTEASTPTSVVPASARTT